VLETIDTDHKVSVVGLGTDVHALPFQRRIVPPLPTIQPSVADDIATSRRWLVVGLGNDVHVLPFQRRINPFTPTVQPSEGETMSTEAKLFVVGLDTDFQVEFEALASSTCALVSLTVVKLEALKVNPMSIMRV
jgi:hypothetical protein